MLTHCRNSIDQKTRETEVEALRRAHVMCQEKSEYSREAAHATRVISAMLAKISAEASGGGGGSGIPVREASHGASVAAQLEQAGCNGAGQCPNAASLAPGIVPSCDGMPCDTIDLGLDQPSEAQPLDELLADPYDINWVSLFAAHRPFR